MKSIIVNSKSIQHWEESCNQYLSLLDRGTVFSDGELPTYAIDRKTCLQDFNAAICMSSFASLSPLLSLQNSAYNQKISTEELQNSVEFSSQIPDICLFDRFYMEIITGAYQIIDENSANLDLNKKLADAKIASREFDEKLPIFSTQRREKVYSGIVFLIPRFNEKQSDDQLEQWLQSQLSATHFMLAGYYFAPKSYQWLYKEKYYPGVLLIQDADIQAPLQSFNIKNFATDDIV